MEFRSCLSLPVGPGRSTVFAVQESNGRGYIRSMMKMRRAPVQTFLRERCHSRFAQLTGIFLGLTLLAAAPAWAGQFTIVDGKAPQEISEVSRVYLDGELVATFVLNDTMSQKTATITTAAGRVEHTYALCGEIVIRTPEGRTETHVVSSTGHLHNPDGHVFQAMGARDFTDFYLIDPSDPGATDHQPGQGDSCMAATS